MKSDQLKEIANMKTSRMEAFSDGVLAIIITIMVLELKVPHVLRLFSIGDFAFDVDFDFD